MVEMRRCKICALEQPKHEFPKARKKNNQPGWWYRRVCARCYYYTKTPARKRNRYWLIKKKEQMACEICGYSKKTNSRFVIEALQFHHTDNNKSFSIADGVQRGVSLSKLEKEIKKCIVLCARCHIEEHYL
tara:strand:- start:6435 stop:6827 length:393 start_codon:yes stop_codon:yes gene_type:complete